MIKKESAATLTKVGERYLSLPSRICKEITDAVALGIWVYLQSQSEGYIIRAQHIQDHFEIGRERYAKAMLYLKNSRLIRHIKLKSSNGTFSDNIIECHALPYENISISTGHTENRMSGETRQKTTSPDIRKTGLPVNRTAGKPDCRKPVPLNKVFSLSKDAEREPTPETRSIAERVSMALRDKNIQGTPDAPDPALCAHITAGLTYDEIIASAEWCLRNNRNSFGYVIARAVKRREDAAKIGKLPEKPKSSSAPAHPSHVVSPPAAPKPRSKPPETLFADLKNSLSSR